MATFLRVDEGIEPVLGRDPETGEWLNLQDLAPDYVFYQTPYDDLYPPEYRSDVVSLYARLCYIPYYGILVYEGQVARTTHPSQFLSNLAMSFVAHEGEREEMLTYVSEGAGRPSVLVTGSPMLDPFYELSTPEGGAWNLPRSPGVKRILWTPRWHTSEGNCHFFDYKDYLLGIARTHQSIDLLFRPHPLSLSNFATTGEFTSAERDRMFAEYEQLPNASIDESHDYLDTFCTSDFLISDMSSMMAEYFATGKPIVYTHRVDTFNSFGRELARGFYWVTNEDELDGIIQMLLRDEDPLDDVRQEILHALLPRPLGGAAGVVKEQLAVQFADLPAWMSLGSGPGW